MNSSMTVIVLCPQGRRQTVKASQNTSILEVLEEACRKQGINPEDYDINHYNKPLDVSLSIRFANLPNNAMLELNPTKRARREGTVTVCLQLESGERITQDFSPSSSMLDIIQKCYSSQDKLLENEIQGEPVCVYMRQKIIGDDIKKTTLRSLGLTKGKAIIRLMYRQLETLNQQAHVSLPLTKPPTLTEPPPLTKPPPLKSELPVLLNRKSSFPSPDYQSSKQPRLDMSHEEEQRDADDYFSKLSRGVKASGEQDSFSEPMQLGSNSCDAVIVDINANDSTSKTTVPPNDSEIMEFENCQEIEPVKEIGEIIYLGSRNAVLFSLEDISEVRKVDLPDDFFELTIDDARYLMNDFQRQRHDIENEPLMLKSQRDSRILQQLTCYKQTVIRIYFPDKLVLQGTFIGDETVQSVWDFVKNFLEDKNLNFYLYITPPKTKLLCEHTLLQLRLVPAAVIYFGCDVHRNSYLHPDVKGRISDPRAATLAAAEYRKQKVAYEQLELISDQDIAAEPITSMEATSDVNSSCETTVQQIYQPPISDSKAPKWFKLGKK